MTHKKSLIYITITYKNVYTLIIILNLPRLDFMIFIKTTNY